MCKGPPNKTPDPKNSTAPPGFEIPGSATEYHKKKTSMCLCFGMYRFF